MHNTPKRNLEFQITFTETNLRWLLGEPVRDEEKIQQTKNKIAELKLDLKAN